MAVPVHLSLCHQLMNQEASMSACNSMPMLRICANDGCSLSPKLFLHRHETYLFPSFWHRVFCDTSFWIGPRRIQFTPLLIHNDILEKEESLFSTLLMMISLSQVAPMPISCLKSRHSLRRYVSENFWKSSLNAGRSCPLSSNHDLCLSFM